ncbi:FkbM family methyltransferase [Tepidamorphus gemmatus]|uniref:FkbM family methyltransferase n=1 Tax=Tepidamorphus gemmatus TaxID=747076 RepID=A0A4V2UZU1_9HYPH|nr:FkbM family methyltransferase [Tepidamorphus gemmatus]TCT12683.1 FkbM family methyltransferase [Tepidamorphus gemmatus]
MIEHNHSDAGTARDAPAFGTFAPSALQARLIDFTRSRPDTWLGKRCAFLARRLAMMTFRGSLDVEVFGQRMRLYPFNNVSEKRILFTPQFFDPLERQLLAGRIGADFVFIDIGANIGAYSLFVAGLAGHGARILAIEPQPDVFERLVANISLNPSGTVKAIGCALADREGEMTLFLATRNKGESSVKFQGAPLEEGQSVQVPARTLLGLIEDEGLDHIDAIKIDVEGAEDLILIPFLRDAPPRLLPRLFIVENARGRWQTDCIAELEAMGYAIIAETRLNVVLERDGC